MDATHQGCGSGQNCDPTTNGKTFCQGNASAHGCYAEAGAKSMRDPTPVQSMV